ncbi:STAS domain-containing protein [Rhizosphaericola mali]|uniref:STAS domain-containing protein n=1 Tax=Rhizosphaericola mali TaxID=2545455 RepID=A0A5P2GG43_9BACT|nr:STAS domain-containing protein [Rhizosphaericola mali]QES90661.1 STAS domain-containing protein [Rhizosphaericola mali]
MSDFKFDTKEKFNVITSNFADLSDNTADELIAVASNLLKGTVKNVIIKCNTIQTISENAAFKLQQLYVLFLENNASLVFCEIQSEVRLKLEALDISEMLNITPTESEAWDIVQMEEIERDLLKED